MRPEAEQPTLSLLGVAVDLFLVHYLAFIKLWLRVVAQSGSQPGQEQSSLGFSANGDPGDGFGSRIGNMGPVCAPDLSPAHERRMRGRERLGRT